MENFEEFDNQTAVPKQETGEIISHAFQMYKGSFLYVLLALVIYIVASSVLQTTVGFDSQDLTNQIKNAGGDFSKLDIWSLHGMKIYTGFSGLLGLLLAPLFVGLLYIFNQYNTKNPLKAADLFIGYKQNFLNILLYALITQVVLGISTLMCFFPVLFVAPFFMLGYPILLFENASFSEALNKSFHIAKENYSTFLGASLLAMLISISGVILCGIGIMLTLYFYLAVMYSLYVAYLGKPKALIEAPKYP